MKVRTDEFADDFEGTEENVLLEEEIDDPDAPMYSRVSFGKWMIVLLVMAIPVANIIMLLVWAFGSQTNPSLANFCRAFLIYLMLIIALFFAFSTVIMNIMLRMVNLG